MYFTYHRTSTHRRLDSNKVSDLNYQRIRLLILGSSLSGESPPPPPRVCFGRDELTEEIISLAEDLTPIALIGPGGIGKTSIALTVLHHDRIKEQFGDERRFIRCDQFPASRTHFLSRLSKVIGAGVENPEDLTPLRPFLSSRKMILFLDNAESVLDPQGTNAQEIYRVVEELSQFKTICLCITSRISTVPRHCKRPVIRTLSMESACDIFYAIYDNGGRSDIISDLLKQLDFHALSITLLATAASHNMWDHDRLAREWDAHRTQVLRTDYNESLAATIELSLASPMFQKLGPDARDLLGVIAFFPQGVDENNLEWLFPGISNKINIPDRFCTLSLTYRNNGFITMLAPLRDYLSPKDPKSSPLLCTTKEHYFSRLSGDVDPDKPGYEEARWVTSEDVNIEHLLNVFTAIDTNSVGVWDACAHFMEHLYWHKTRPVVLGSKVEGLPDDHPSKPAGLFQLSRLFGSVGNFVESKRLIDHTLEFQREREGSLEDIARTMVFSAMTSWNLGLHKEGIPLAREALGIYERLGHVVGQAQAWQRLARLLYCDNQLDAAQEAASRSIGLLEKEGERYRLCQSHRIIGEICHSKGETEKAITHFKTAIEIASRFDWRSQLSRAHYSLAVVFSGEQRLGDAYAHAKHAELHAVSYPYHLGRAIHLQARFWDGQDKLEEAKSEALRAIDVYQRTGATKDEEECRAFLRKIETKMRMLVTSDEPDFNGKPLEMVLLPTLVNSPFLVHGTG